MHTFIRYTRTTAILNITDQYSTRKYWNATYLFAYSFILTNDSIHSSTKTREFAFNTFTVYLLFKLIKIL